MIIAIVAVFILVTLALAISLCMLGIYAMGESITTIQRSDY